MLASFLSLTENQINKFVPPPAMRFAIEKCIIYNEHLNFIFSPDGQFQSRKKKMSITNIKEGGHHSLSER